MTGFNLDGSHDAALHKLISATFRELATGCLSLQLRLLSWQLIDALIDRYPSCPRDISRAVDALTLLVEEPS